MAIALASSGAEVPYTRAIRHVPTVAMIVSGEAEPWPPEPGSWDLLVNCTPVGIYPDPDETPVGRALTGAWFTT